MAQGWQILLGLWTVMFTSSGDKPVNICMNAKHHKQEPGPEDKLYLEVQGQELAQGWLLRFMREGIQARWSLYSISPDHLVP